MATSDTVTTNLQPEEIKESLVGDGEERTCIDFPRIHFYGRFRANIGTGNNVQGNYKVAMEYGAGEGERKILDPKDTDTSPGYLYNGDMTYNWMECKITSVYGKDGVCDTTTFKDFQINPSTRQVSGRLNDLDVWQQMISRIFGFEVNICDTNDNNKYLLRSKLKPCSFRDIWFRAYPGDSSSSNNDDTLKEKIKEKKQTKGGDELMSCSYGSILTDCKFADDDKLSNYQVLKDLKYFAAINDNKLQIKFIMDGYNSTAELDTYGYGRVYGCIGVYTRTCPTKAIKNGRYLVSNTPQVAYSAIKQLPQWVGGFNNQFCTVKPTQVSDASGSGSTTKLIVDVSNAIPTVNYDPQRLESDNFDPVCVDVGDILIYQVQSTLNNVLIGKIPYSQYSDMSQWRVNCGIFCVDIENGITVDDKYPVMVQFGEDDTKINDFNDNYIKYSKMKIGWQLFEPINGWYVSSEDLPFRLGTTGIYEPINCPQEQSFQVYASKYGKPINVTDLIGMKTVKAFQWSPSKDEPQDKPSNLDTINKEFKFVINKNKGVNNGIFEVVIKAPDTLEDDTTKLLPRNYYYMDSVIWNLIIQVPIKQSIENRIDDLQSLELNLNLDIDDSISLVQTNPVGHNKVNIDKDGVNAKNVIKTVAKNNEKTKKIEKDIINDIETIIKDEELKSLYFFVGGALVFNELPKEKMPPVPLWQPNMATDLNNKNWLEFLDSDEFKKEHKPYVHAILRPYQSLYPIMSNIVNLDWFADVTSKLDSMIRGFNQPWESPYYMPITRDMSGMNQVIVKEWLRNPVFCDAFVEKIETLGGFVGVIKDVNTLKDYLQGAIELELSTLPPYLSALYSMDATNIHGSNSKIIQLIRSIVHQEMQHFALACNLLLSIGGKPKIAFKDVVERTTFPRIGLKPATDNVLPVLPELPLELRPMSVDGKDASVLTFMYIEAPSPFAMEGADKSQDEIQNGIKGDITDELNSLKSPLLHRVAFTRNNIFAANKNKFHTTLNGVKTTLVSNNNQDEDVKENTTGSEESNKDDVALSVVFRTTNDTDIKTKGDNVDTIKFLEDVSNGLKDSGIGAFYQVIRKAFAFLSRNDEIGQENLFVNYGKGSKNCIYDGQIGPSMMPGCNFVYDLDSALTAIETIVSEGEGTSITDIWQDGVNEANLSHFHKFLEIKVGYPIIAAERVGIDDDNHAIYKYVFAKNDEEKIEFDDKCVESSNDAWDWLKLDKSNPKNKEDNDTTKNENAKDIRVITFNETYGKLLCALQDMIDPEIVGTLRERNEMNFAEIEETRQKQIKKAIGVMRQLQINFCECLTPEVMPGFGVLIDGAPTDPKYKPLAPNWVPPDYCLYSDE